MLTIMLVVDIFLATGCYGALEKFPNARYLGMGYNAIKGNPDNDLHDPGFSFSVLDFTWTSGKATSDGKYLVPDHIQALQTKSCGFQSEASTEFGAQSYQKALSVDVSIQSGFDSWIWKARFSASAGYRKVSQGTSQYRRIYTSARAKCIQYQLSVNYMHAAIKVTSNFAQAVSDLPLVRNDGAYNTFINTYGTHFTSSVTMGAKMVVRSEFEEIALSRMEETGLNVEASAKLSFWRFSAGISTETSLERQQREAFEGMRKSYSASFLGSHPPSDGRWETWAQSTADSPYPIRYKLVPLTALVTSKFFPDMPADELSTRRDLLAAAYDNYCSAVPECGVPAADRVPVRMTKAVSKFHGTQRVSCPPTYKLLSCGMLHVRAEGSYDRKRYAIPADDNSCECHDKNEYKCVSWCSNSAVQIRIVSTVVVNGVTTVYCPSGHKVLGCHAKHTTDSEKWPQYYPLHSGNGCICYNYFGVICVATCAATIRNHEVRHQFGTRSSVTVTCSPGNFVLGCGIKPKATGGGNEKWRNFAVKSLNSCECYDYSGATCYAICGRM